MAEVPEWLVLESCASGRGAGFMLIMTLSFFWGAEMLWLEAYYVDRKRPRVLDRIISTVRRSFRIYCMGL